jgi:hypothetical protein
MYCAAARPSAAGVAGPSVLQGAICVFRHVTVETGLTVLAVITTFVYFKYGKVGIMLCILWESRFASL